MVRRRRVERWSGEPVFRAGIYIIYIYRAKIFFLDGGTITALNHWKSSSGSIVRIFLSFLKSDFSWGERLGFALALP